MRLVDGSIKRPVTVFMVTVGIVLFGMVAASRLAVDLLPDISYPSLTIRTDFPVMFGNKAGGFRRSMPSRMPR